mmetsp:Transcript_3809/g.13365  ORF Transcript_3809/g.13365 Transcript_3809/m.13365 type:complete len:482 (-) Transcript_3809:980-2425(-)
MLRGVASVGLLAVPAGAHHVRRPLSFAQDPGHLLAHTAPSSSSLEAELEKNLRDHPDDVATVLLNLVLAPAVQVLQVLYARRPEVRDAPDQVLVVHVVRLELHAGLLGVLDDLGPLLHQSPLDLPRAVKVLALLLASLARPVLDRGDGDLLCLEGGLLPGSRGGLLDHLQRHLSPALLQVPLRLWAHPEQRRHGLIQVVSLLGLFREDAVDHELLHKPGCLRFEPLGPRPKGRDAVVPKPHHLCALGTAEDVHDVGQGVGLPRLPDDGDHVQHVLGDVLCHVGLAALLVVPAVVARPLAQALVEGLPKVPEEQGPAALDGVLAIRDHAVQALQIVLQLGPGRVVLLCALLQEPLELLVVAEPVEQDADRGLQIPARPTGLLVVPLQGLGQRVVDDEPDVRLVDPHAKGHSGAQDVHLIIAPLLLDKLPLLRLQARVVKVHDDPPEVLAPPVQVPLAREALAAPVVRELLVQFRRDLFAVKL